MGGWVGERLGCEGAGLMAGVHHPVLLLAVMFQCELCSAVAAHSQLHGELELPPSHARHPATPSWQVTIGDGPGRGMAWGCDLSYDYVKINAEYTTQVHQFFFLLLVVGSDLAAANGTCA